MSRLFAENLTPAEQRKLKNKLRKRAKKEALLKKEKQEEQHKKEQKAKGAADADLDGPKEEELVPDKLARVSSERHTRWKQCVLSCASDLLQDFTADDRYQCARTIPVKLVL